MRNRLQNFMYGRYGNDQLNQCLWIAALVLIVLDIILSRFFVRVGFLWIIVVVLLVVGYWRMLSRNTTRRALENEKFMGFFYRFRRDGGSSGNNYGGNAYNSGSRSAYTRQENSERRKAQRQDKRYYKYFNCPNCNQKVRVPKGRGKIEITCPKCRTSFIRKT